MSDYFLRFTSYLILIWLSYYFIIFIIIIIVYISHGPNISLSIWHLVCSISPYMFVLSIYIISVCHIYIRPYVVVVYIKVYFVIKPNLVSTLDFTMYDRFYCIISCSEVFCHNTYTVPSMQNLVLVLYKLDCRRAK